MVLIILFYTQYLGCQVTSSNLLFAVFDSGLGSNPFFKGFEILFQQKKKEKILDLELI